MKTEHNHTEPTPTSLRREAQGSNKYPRHYQIWRDDARINAWCEWEIRCFPFRVKSMIQHVNSDGVMESQVWS